MGLRKVFNRLWYIYSWRLRYWYLDTSSGKRAQLWLFFASMLFSVIWVARLSTIAYLQITTDAPALAIADWIVYLIYMVISLAISYATRPKPEKPKPQEGKVPITEDGQCARHVFGTVWIDDSFQLAHKNLRAIPIKSKGGKK